MLEKIIELLLGLAVAAAAAFGIDTATTSPHSGGVEREASAGKPATSLLKAPDLAALGAEAADDAREVALEALERVMDSAPDAAAGGLQNAWDHVSAAGSDGEAADAAGAAPVDVPVGPPMDVPVEPPVDTPIGPPSFVPPAAGGQP